MPRTKNNPETQQNFSTSLNALLTLRKIKDAATLGRLTGIDEAAISRYINGKAMPNAESLLALSQALGVKMEELLTGITAADIADVPGSIEGRLSNLERCDREAGERFLLLEQRCNTIANAILSVYDAIRGLAAYQGGEHLIDSADKNMRDLRMIIGGKGGG